MRKGVVLLLCAAAGLLAVAMTPPLRCTGNEAAGRAAGEQHRLCAGGEAGEKGRTVDGHQAGEYPLQGSWRHGGDEMQDVPSASPYIRWWWFADVIRPEDVRSQLDWLKANGFGGVEMAFVYPLHGDSAAARLPWLSQGWSQAVADAARYCDTIGLGCDITFGTLWPFGDSMVPPEDGALVYTDSIAPTRMRLTWEHPVRGRVLNHLDHEALRRYADRMFAALEPALQGKQRHLFCDSWEVETRKLWRKGFEDEFRTTYGYDILPMIDSLYVPAFAPVRYDYMKLISRLVLDEFYTPFVKAAHEHGALTRVQCCGAPTDLLAAYGRIDIPEGEAILYEPAFSRIPASAAVLSRRHLVSAETFTCLYGWKGWPGPGPHQGEERVDDMKLLADAMFAHGVNWIVWHGMPFNPPDRHEKFYASVHVGPDASFAAALPAFNSYLTEVSSFMRKGHSYSDVAVYLPLEDAWMDGELPDSLKMPWAWGEYEMRYQRTPEEIKGYQPLWINAEAIEKGIMHDGRMRTGDAAIRTLYVDARYLDRRTVWAIFDRASEGLNVCLLQRPSEPGFQTGRLSMLEYELDVDALLALPTVRTDASAILEVPPLVEGRNIPDFWCRSEGETAWLFFAHPASQGLRYPLAYGQAADARAERRELTIHWQGKSIPLVLDFPPGASILVEVDAEGNAHQKTYIIASP
ncbi:MAG: hypothetical protein IH600_09640 [Bacteroidetes bacterium]|nr:hypothetical protein [Bacteroidota bacterium]